MPKAAQTARLNPAYALCFHADMAAGIRLFHDDFFVDIVLQRGHMGDNAHQLVAAGQR